MCRDFRCVNRTNVVGFTRLTRPQLQPELQPPLGSPVPSCSQSYSLHSAHPSPATARATASTRLTCPQLLIGNTAGKSKSNIVCHESWDCCCYTREGREETDKQQDEDHTHPAAHSQNSCGSTETKGQRTLTQSDTVSCATLTQTALIKKKCMFTAFIKPVGFQGRGTN